MMTRRTPYTLCARCGAHLDPGERCDCEQKAAGHALSAKAIKRKPPQRTNDISRAWKLWDCK